MNIEYVCHACLLIETEDLRIVTDPWFAGPANCGQWHVFPKPVNHDKTKDVDLILISHGHEDHLHEETLRQLDRSARVMFPYSFFGGAKEYIESLGFENVREAVTFRKYRVSEKTAVTFILNSHDSIMVVESGGEVLVNINDALHSYADKVIDYYTDVIKQRWPQIDQVFCGFGGSSYFPNTMHLAGKNDIEIALVREQLFVNNFCRIVKALDPKVAVPFAADFALLDPDQHWINDVRFPRSEIAEYYRRYFATGTDDPVIETMYSGDRIEGTEFRQLSPYHLQLEKGETGHLVSSQYGGEIERRGAINFITENEAQELAERVLSNVRKRMALYKPHQVDGLKFLLNVTDVETNNLFHIEIDKGRAKVWRSAEVGSEFLLTMKLSSAVLNYSIGSDWGADVISVGYGAEIFISDSKVADVELERICMNLLACYPTISEWKSAPLRSLAFLLLGPPRYTTSLRKLKRFCLESENYDRKTWLLNDAGEIRRRYHLPELDAPFLPRRLHAVSLS